MGEQLSVKRINLIDFTEHSRFYYEIKNETEEVVYLDDFVLFEGKSLEELGLDCAECKVFRSGRHKNDMPSVFMLGENTEALMDALSGMTETGDKKSVDSSNRRIVSDHLTILGNDDRYLVITFPGGRKQFFETDIEIDDEANFAGLTSKVHFGIKLAPGQIVSTEVIDLELTADVKKSIDRFATEKAKVFRARNRSTNAVGDTNKPSVFCTWYYYGLTVTLDDVLTNLDKIQEKKLPFDVFQVDEGWEITLGEWMPNQKFPIDMKALADRIKAAGLRPGIWTGPFVAHETATIWKMHPEWALKNKNGETCLFHMNGTVYWVFDITNPGTWDYFRELFNKLTFDWGYTYHKLDFTRAAVIYDDAVYYDETITLVEAYYNAVKAIREGMGEDSYFLMCGGLYDPIIGLVDAQRTGSDVLSMWSSTINKDGKTAPYTMKQSMLRYYMNYWWDNDPDALMVRVNPQMERDLRLTYGLLNDEEVKTSVINQYMGGGIVCSTEPLDKISDDRLSNLAKVMPAIPRTCYPVDLMNTDERFPEKVKIDLEDGVTSSFVRINWSDSEVLDIIFTMDEKMLPPKCNSNDTFVIADYYGGVYQTGVKVGDEIKLSTLAPHAATVIKIEKQSDKPIIVKSNGHFAMGHEGVEMSMNDGELHVEYENNTGFEVDFTILLSDGSVVKKSFDVN